MRADDCGDRAFDGGIAGRKIGAATGADSLAFFDAIAPIVYAETINMDIAWRAARWDKGAEPASRWIDGKDYINCPMNKAEYLAFAKNC
jgi:methylenetetrahydrofolate--tRNA-(uracil-5-)-methyltransferase